MAKANALNDQILESVRAAARAAAGGAGGQEAVADQLVTLAVTLAMQNAVAQQQHAYALQNAATTALVKALLEAGSEPQAARLTELLQSVRALFSEVDVSATILALKAVLDELAVARRARAAAAGGPGGAAQAPPQPGPRPPGTSGD